MKKIGNSSIFYEKYKPQCIEDVILPEALKQSLIIQIQNKDIKNIGLFSDTPGCLLPGTRINVMTPENIKTLNELKIIYNLSNKELNRLKNNLNLSSEFIDINSIPKEFIMMIKTYGETYRSAIALFKHDNKYNDKHLKLLHWLKKVPIEQAIKKTSVLRKYKHFFDINLKKFENWKKENLIKNILKIKFELIYSDVDNLKKIYKNIDKRTTIDFWTMRGYSENEAKSEIFRIQHKNALAFKDLRNKDKDKYRDSYLMNKEYWLKRGYDEKEALNLAKQRQQTFSLDTCIKKYGEEIGLLKFIERQEKWQKTLNDKSDEEKQIIYRKRGATLSSKLKNNKCYLYYLKFYNNDSVFWKIGITSNENVENGRFENKQLFKLKYNLNYEVIFVKEFESAVEAFNEEQKTLLEFNEFRINVNFNGFKTTEAFKKDILEKI